MGIDTSRLKFINNIDKDIEDSGFVKRGHHNYYLSSIEQNPFEQVGSSYDGNIMWEFQEYLKDRGLI